MIRLGVSRFGVGLATGTKILDECAALPDGHRGVDMSRDRSSPTTWAPAATRPRSTMPRAGCWRRRSSPTTPTIRRPAGTSSGPSEWWDSVVQSTRQLLADRRGRSRRASAAWRSPATAWAACRWTPTAGCCATSTPIWSDKRPGGPGRAVLREGRSGPLVPAHRQRLSRAALHGLQDPLVPRPRAGDVPPHPQGDRHQGLHQLPADRPHRHRLFLRLGQRRLRPAGLGLLRRAAGRRRTCRARFCPRSSRRRRSSAS